VHGLFDDLAEQHVAAIWTAQATGLREFLPCATRPVHSCWAIATYPSFFARDAITCQPRVLSASASSSIVSSGAGPRASAPRSARLIRRSTRPPAMRIDIGRIAIAMFASRFSPHDTAQRVSSVARSRSTSGSPSGGIDRGRISFPFARMLWENRVAQLVARQALPQTHVDLVEIGVCPRGRSFEFGSRSALAVSSHASFSLGADKINDDRRVGDLIDRRLNPHSRHRLAGGPANDGPPNRPFDIPRRRPGLNQQHAPSWKSPELSETRLQLAPKLPQSPPRDRVLSKIALGHDKTNQRPHRARNADSVGR